MSDAGGVDDPPREAGEQDEDDIASALREEEMERPPELKPHGSSPPFKVVSDLLEEISSSSARKVGTIRAWERRKNYLERFFELYRERVGLDLFPVVRLIVPDRDRQRSTYGVKESALAKLYIDALGLDKNASYDAGRLLKWKEPAPGERGAGDFAEIAYSLIQSRSLMIGETGKLSVEQVNRHLDSLSALHSRKKGSIISIFHKNMSPIEQKWLIRIILKDLKISIRERTVLQILHPDAVNLFNVCSDLRRVCWTLWNREYHLPRDEQEVKVFMSFRPMLCKRNEKSLEHIVKSMMKDNPDKIFYIEEKLDGERIQLHVKGGEFRYYSRNDKDYSYLYGRNARDTKGALTKHIYDCIRGVDEVILDGEMMVYDPISARFTPFGFLKSAALDISDNPNKPRACFKVFDILYFKRANDTTGYQLLERPLIQRREFLLKVVKEKRGYIEFDQCQTGKQVGDIRDALERILDNNGEGLVIKHPRAFYVLNGREDTWCKVKPDYMDSLGESFDCTCIGGFWGSGKRGGNFGSFIVGVLDSKSGEYMPPLLLCRQFNTDSFLSFSKVGSGISLSHLKEIDHHFASKFKEMPRNKSQNPPGLKFRKERPDVYIDPADSFVITIKASEILVDPDGMASGLCLRFPRIEKIHTGESAKDPMQQLSYGDLINKKNEAGSSKRRITTDNLDAHKKRKLDKPAPRSRIALSHSTLDLSSIAVESSLFEGISFWIVQGLPKHKKEALEKLVHQHGGQLSQTVPKDIPRRIISPSSNFMQAKALIDKGHSLVQPSWILDSIETGRCLPLLRYLVHEAEDLSFDGMEDRAADDMSDSGVGLAAETRKDEEPAEDFASMKKIRAAIPDSEDEDEATHDSTRDAAAAAHGQEAADRSWNALPSPSRLSKSVTDGTDSDEEDVDRHQHYIADPQGPGMAAEDPDARDYDPDNIFRHMVFYLDTKDSAQRIKLPCSNALSLVHPTMTMTSNIIKKAGGTVSESIYDPALTHIVLAKKDVSRQASLRKLSAPEGTRQKRLVTTEWIIDSYENETLLNEQDYAPR